MCLMPCDTVKYSFDIMELTEISFEVKTCMLIFIIIYDLCKHIHTGIVM